MLVYRMTRKFRSRDGEANVGTKDACPLKAVSGIRFEGPLKRFDINASIFDLASMTEGGGVKRAVTRDRSC